MNVVVYDAEGRIVIKQSFDQQTDLNVGMLETGVYYVKISNDSLMEVRKLVIK